MSETTVKTEEELKQAIQNEIETIIVENPELVSKLKNLDRLKKCAPWAVGLTLAAIVAVASTPTTGPVGPTAGAAFFATSATATGIAVTDLIAISVLAVVLGLTCFFAIYNGYDFEIEVGWLGKKGVLRLKKNKK